MTTFLRGRAFETAAARFLESKGWTVLARNVRVGPVEIDLVVVRDGVLAFVEVKGRGRGAPAHPLAWLTRRKRARVVRAARGWLQRTGGTWRGVRFDAVSVREGAPGRLIIEHVEDAWRADD
ncbi:MAG: YraN family protein [Gemmatimonadetes bacterium]|nr:MAG: YraN family protein [Gemmatimonadota bacterium]